MASTYTTNAGIELIGTGEQSGTWGTTTNTNLQIIDRITNGVGVISLSGTTHTLTTTNGTLSDGQYAVLVFGGSPSGTNTVTISPNTNQHVYIVKNNSGENVVLTQGTGGDVTVADGDSAIIYADGAGSGAAVVDITSTFDLGYVTSVAATGGTGISITGSPITSSGTLTITNTAPDQTVVLTAGSNISVTGTYPNFTIAVSASPTFTTVDFGDWTITESGGSLYFATSGTNKMRLDSSGNLDIVGNVNSNATIT